MQIIIPLETYNQKIIETYHKTLTKKYGVLEEDVTTIISNHLAVIGTEEKIGFQELKEKTVPIAGEIDAVYISIFGTIIALQLSLPAPSDKDWNALDISWTAAPSFPDLRAVAINQPINGNTAESALLALAEKTPNVSAFYSLPKKNETSFISPITMGKLSILWKNLRVIL